MHQLLGFMRNYKIGKLDTQNCTQTICNIVTNDAGTKSYPLVEYPRSHCDDSKE